MAFQVRITAEALADLEEVMAFSWESFPESSERFGRSLLNHIELLGQFPRLGHPVANAAGIYALVHQPFLVYYQIDQDRKAIEVLHIWHGKRQKPALAP